PPSDSACRVMIVASSANWVGVTAGSAPWIAQLRGGATVADNNNGRVGRWANRPENDCYIESYLPSLAFRVAFARQSPLPETPARHKAVDGRLRFGQIRIDSLDFRGRQFA